MTPEQITIEALQASLINRQELIEKLIEDRNVLYQRDLGVGGMYRRQDKSDMEKSELLHNAGSVKFDTYDAMNIVWSRTARMKFRISGTASVVQPNWFHSLPYNVRAESWWHLCSQVGLIEPMARLFYHHPENGQESAVSKAKPVQRRPVQRGPIIACQGDYID